MATGHTLQPCGLQLAFGLDAHDLQRLTVDYNRIAKINENELQAQEVTSVESQPPTVLHAIRRSVHKIKLPPTEVPKPRCQTTEFKHFNDTFKSLVIKQTISRYIIIHCLQ
jgi:dihydroneopterin aldolase